MKKWGKGLMGLVAAGGALAGLIYYLKKKDNYEEEEFDDEFEDNDFDLDSDLKPVSDREYVSLNPSQRMRKKQSPKKPLPLQMTIWMKTKIKNKQI